MITKSAAEANLLRMGVSPASLFVLGALAVASTVGVLAAKAKSADDDAGPGLPGDAKAFGFVVRGDAAPLAHVPLLEATRAFTIGLTNGPVHGVPPTTAHRDAARRVVERELDRYPPTVLRRIRLAGVVLTADLTENEMAIPSLPNVGGLLLLDTRATEADLVRVLHHEVFHFFDLADDGVVAPDAAWEALNPLGFLYGSGGRTLRGAWAAKPTSDLPGVVSAYATSGVEEDKAETFSFAMSDPAFVNERAAADPAVRAKLDELVRRLAAVTPDAPRRLGLPPPISRP